jgi:hypothetical protein
LITLGPAILVDANSPQDQIRTHFEAILARYEEDYEEQFLVATQVRVKEVGIGTPKVTTPSTPAQEVTLASPEDAPGPTFNTFETPSTSVETSAVIGAINHLGQELPQVWLAERRQERRSAGYERLAESLAMGLEQLLNLPIQGISPTTPTMTPPVSAATSEANPQGSSLNIPEWVTSILQGLNTTVQSNSHTIQALQTQGTNLQQMIKTQQQTLDRLGTLLDT